ncbi:MAG: asparagine synthase (glutamine-hydrolyzing) [Acidobacteria bacterium]|nr:asparagine synthase (glutamine-hydrolyzing) [Acidobacteriota bacterium]
MCGICGLYGFSEPLPRLDRMQRALIHRGPDSEGQYYDGQIALGIRRLAIIDLKTGEQPIYNEDHSVVVVFNGEIYNYQELASELVAKGHRFVTHTDTETIVHAYEEYGPDCVQHLRGMFAFAVWDRKTQKLFLARDRFGIKPLYFWQTGSQLAFASEVRALLAGEVTPRSLSQSGLKSYLAYGAVQEPLTLVDGVYSLLPGQTLTLGHGRISIQRYWAPPHQQSGATDRDLPEIQREVCRLLSQSVAQHLLSDVPLGVFLSGGMDSGTVVGLMSQAVREPVRSFTIHFRETEFDESRAAIATAEYWKTQQTTVLLTGDEILHDLPQAVAAMDQPTVDGVNSWYVSRAARRGGVKVALSGLGGDELFGGYPTFREIPWMERAGALLCHGPLLLRRMGASVTGRLLGKNDVAAKLDAFLRDDTYFPHPYYVHRVLFTPARCEELLRARHRNGSVAAAWRRKVADDLDHAAFYDAVGAISYLELRNYLLCTLLRDADCMSMAHSLELRVPMLDHELVEYVIRVPGRLKVTGKRAKPLLVGAMKGILLPGRRYEKRPFTFPWRAWLSTSLRSQLEKTFSDHESALDSALDHPSVAAVWNRFLAGQTSWARPWALYVLERWIARHLG